ncbi:MAG: hypothetical protein ABI091_22970 [Ferruginibacter sp.]
MKRIYFVAILTFSILQGFAQNVGIGTVTPLEKLHVAGNIKSDTIKPNAIKLLPNAGNGRVLTSDALGNASWQQNSNSAAGNIGYGVWGDCATNGNIADYFPVTDTSLYGGFGESVSISGNYAIVGAFNDATGANPPKGSASIYHYSGNNWVFMQKLTDATGTNNERFGASVSISGNYAIVGAYLDDVGANVDQGSASIYRFNGSTWVLLQKIIDATGAAGDSFGNSVSISGTYVIVGAYLDDIGANVDQGSASIYQYNGSTWVLMQKITDATGAANDNFGWDTKISGKMAIIGSPNDDVAANTDQGSSSVYKYNGSTWGLMQKITDGNGTVGDNFGNAVAIEGNYAVVGAPGHKVGANFNVGNTNIYKLNGSTWTILQQIDNPQSIVGDRFGYSATISGNYIMLSSSQTINGNNQQGSAFIYQKIGIGWQKLQTVIDPAGVANDFFSAVAIDGTTKLFLIGAYGFAGSSGKVVFGKIN